MVFTMVTTDKTQALMLLVPPLNPRCLSSLQ